MTRLPSPYNPLLTYQAQTADPHFARRWLIGIIGIYIIAGTSLAITAVYAVTLAYPSFLPFHILNYVEIATQLGFTAGLTACLALPVVRLRVLWALVTIFAVVGSVLVLLVMGLRQGFDDWAFVEPLVYIVQALSVVLPVTVMLPLAAFLLLRKPTLDVIVLICIGALRLLLTLAWVAAYSGNYLPSLEPLVANVYTFASLATIADALFAGLIVRLATLLLFPKNRRVV